MNHDYQLQADPADEVFGQIAALAFIVKRLVAEQAKRFPDGVARQMIDQRDLVVQSIASTRAPPRPSKAATSRRSRAMSTSS